MARALRVLLIEDDATLGPALMQRLRLEGFDPVLAADGASALAVVARQPPDAVLSDIRLPDMDGEAIWRRMLDGQGPLPTWFMTAHGDVGQAVRLVKAGARDYLTKPVDVDGIVAALGALRPPTVADGTGGFGVSPAARAFEAELAKAAKSDLPILLAGETGSGKEVAAKLAHRRSSRAAAPFVALNCAAIPAELAESVLFGHEKGAFTGALARRAGVAEEAGQGTLFLDEIAELAPPLQAKLLRLVEAKEFRPVGARGEAPFRARLICATHADLTQRVRDGRFREDLLYRLNVIPLRVPPLRARDADIEHLARAFAADAAARAGRASVALAAEALDALRAHEWPGNVRELRNRVERAVAMAEGSALGVEDLFPEARLDFRAARDNAESGESSLDAAAQAAIRERVADALARAGGNRTEAAKLLGVSRTTIWKYSK